MKRTYIFLLSVIGLSCNMVFAAGAQHTFTLTAQQEAVLLSQANRAGMTVDEFIDANCIQKFIGEIVSREIQKDSGMIKADYEKSTDDQKARIKTILNEGK